MNIRTLGLSSSVILLFFLLIGCAAHATSENVAQLADGLQSLQSGTENGSPDAQLDQADSSSDQDASEVDNADDSSLDETKNGGAVPAEENPLDTALELTETSRDLWEAGEAEKAIESLDHAYELILKAPADAEGKTSQQKDDLRFMISKRLTEIYTSRLTSVRGLNKEIPLVMNEYVEREIKLFQTVERDFFLESYKRSGRYRGEMAKAFHEAGIPEEITWLPLIESGFKVRALSKARALGLWQFIPSTGYKFGLKRTAWVDERLDPAKSTAAAIAYLKELHDVFGDWATVLAAYNCGEGNVFRVIRQQKIDYLDNFWDLYGRLPNETARYYPRFLAVLTILKDPAKYGFTLGELDKPIPYEVVSVEKPLQLSKISDKIGCSSDDMANLNAELRYAATPNTAYDLKVPFGMKDVVLANIDALPKWSPPRSRFVVHRVRRGETLSAIAIRYRTSTQRIMRANNIKRGRLLRVGQKLKIPTRDTT
jgi:membrane-bound lytic murein transglycosylase D